MVVTKDNPIGIDFVISKIQQALENNLSWSNQLVIYPKCYPISREGGLKTIEHYAGGQGNDYENLVFSEGNKAFFVATEPLRKVDLSNYSTRIECFFILDLKDLFVSNVIEDSKVHNDVLNAIELAANVNIEVYSLVTKIEQVFYGYSYRMENDMSPYHCFKVVIDVKRFKPETNC